MRTNKESFRERKQKREREGERGLGKTEGRGVRYIKGKKGNNKKKSGTMCVYLCNVRHGKVVMRGKVERYR